MPIFFATFALLSSLAAFAAIPEPAEEIEELHHRIVNFDFTVGSQLGPQFISAQAKRFKLRLLLSISPEKQEVTLEMMQDYRRTAKAFNTSVFRYANKTGHFHISKLPLRRPQIAQALLREFLTREKFTIDFDANESIANVQWNNLRMAMELAKKRLALGDFTVGSEIPDRLKESARWTRERQENLCAWFLEPELKEKK